jgi:hypothetical protein
MRKLADRLVSALVPRATAKASNCTAYGRCFCCSAGCYRYQFAYYVCCDGQCGPVQYGNCGSC